MGTDTDQKEKNDMKNKITAAMIFLAATTLIGTTNAATDIDGDDLTDTKELQWGTDPTMPDTDSDGLFDGAEVHRVGTDPLEADSDGDWVWDGDEVAWGTDPLDADSDDDGIPDGEDECPTHTGPCDEPRKPSGRGRGSCAQWHRVQVDASGDFGPVSVTGDPTTAYWCMGSEET